MADKDGICGALWYHGIGHSRSKHVCHRRRGHRDRHHSDQGLWWSSHPHARRVRLDDHQPCPDCEPVRAKTAARR